MSSYLSLSHTHTYSGTSGMSDWDIMMQRRKDAMARARRRRRKDVDITANDDHIMAMIQQMKEAAEEDRHLNMDRKAATKKLQMLPTVITHLKKLAYLTNRHAQYHMLLVARMYLYSAGKEIIWNVVFLISSGLTLRPLSLSVAY